jgi:glycosyltransferase involved in cell wall biosynthesis
VRSALELGRVVVVDAFSEDRTVEIARGLGADVFQQAWLGHASQKNWALANTNIDTPWVLILDADEWLVEDTRQRIAATIGEGGASGYYLPRRNVFLGRELRHAWWYPDFQLRLFRAGSARYEDRLVHEHMIVDGRVEELWADLWHENRKSLHEFIERHNRYSTLEAAEIVDPSSVERQGSLRGNWADRRRALKLRVWLRIPGRPVIRFFWLYVVKRGFLDGRVGFLYCLLIAFYDLMIGAKVYELRHPLKPLVDPHSSP